MPADADLGTWGGRGKKGRDDVSYCICLRPRHIFWLDYTAIDPVRTTSYHAEGKYERTPNEEGGSALKFTVEMCPFGGGPKMGTVYTAEQLASGEIVIEGITCSKTAGADGELHTAGDGGAVIPDFVDSDDERPPRPKAKPAPAEAAAGSPKADPAPKAAEAPVPAPKPAEEAASPKKAPAAAAAEPKAEESPKVAPKAAPAEAPAPKAAPAPAAVAKAPEAKAAPAPVPAKEPAKAEEPPKAAAPAAAAPRKSLLAEKSESLPLDVLKSAEQCRQRGVDPATKEDYLSAEDFQKVFEMDKEAFAKLPKWKKDQRKKAVGLF